MRAYLRTLRLPVRYAWTGCSTNSYAVHTSPRITPVRCSQRGERASASIRCTKGQNTTLKYFVKICCNVLNNAFVFIQYLSITSRNAASTTGAPSLPHKYLSKKRSQKLQITTPYRLLERTVELISGVLASARSVRFEFASIDTRTTSHWTAQ